MAARNIVTTRTGGGGGGNRHAEGQGLLYDLLEGVDRRKASLIKTLVLVSVPISMVNEVTSVAALHLARGGDFLPALGEPQRDTLAMLFIKVHGSGIAISEIFWGLWLPPLGLLVYRSGFIPRVFGVLLTVNGLTYPVLSLTYFLAPQYGPMVARYAMLPEMGELWFMLWLLIRGAIPKAPAASGASLAPVG